MKKWFGFKKPMRLRQAQVLKLLKLYDYIDENEESQAQDTNPQNLVIKGDDNTTEFK